MLTLWPQLAGIKVRPADPVINPQALLALQGARGEGIAGQVILTSDGPLPGLTVELTGLIGPGGATLPADAVALYRVGYINVTMPSEPAAQLGEWPDPLYPIGPDRFYQETRNGAPFDLLAGRNQPIWIDVRIPPAAAPGLYGGELRVTQGVGGPERARLPVQLMVWDVLLPTQPTLPTVYQLNTWQTYCAHYFPGAVCVWNQDEIVALTDLYQREATAHRITLDAPINAIVPYDYDATTGQVSNLNWQMWDLPLMHPGRTTFPLPGPKFKWNDIGRLSWTDAEYREAVAFWKAVGQHYRQQGWLDGNYLYTLDEPHENWTLNVLQSKALAEADSALRALVTSHYTPDLASGRIGIWVPIVNSIDPDGGMAVYAAERAAGKQVWWYDSNNSGESDPAGQRGNWPDEFIDHAGVNQLVHGPLTWKYGLDGYLYYATTENYDKKDEAGNPLNVWQVNFGSGRNGDGTLFYPGRPSDVGGAHHIPAPSIRLQLLRQSWSTYDLLELLHQRGRGDVADRIAAGLVTSTYVWSNDAVAYETARGKIAAALTGP